MSGFCHLTSGFCPPVSAFRAWVVFGGIEVFVGSRGRSPHLLIWLALVEAFSARPDQLIRKPIQIKAFSTTDEHR
jgi:hypothetical protein